MTSNLVVSIIINNYNYARFLGDAIESALQQTYAATEVIVVDDGSTDNSAEVIASYGDRIVPVLKENGGQGSTFNSGFACSHGDVVMFLDADDYLLPETAQRVAQIFNSHSNVVRVHYRMLIVDQNGAETGRVMPSLDRALPSGDMRRQVLAFPDDILWQPTSGNAFAASALRRILPMPEQPYRVCADYYLLNLTPLCGDVVALDGAGAAYRVHDANNEYAASMHMDRLREAIRRTLRTHTELKRFADSLGLTQLPSDPAAVLSVTFLANRMISLRLEPSMHPIDGESASRLCMNGVRATFRRFDLSLKHRVLYAQWFIAMCLIPLKWRHQLAQLFLNPESRRLSWRRVRRERYELVDTSITSPPRR